MTDLAKNGCYWCVFCGHLVVGEPVANEEGEVVGYVFVHDDVEHPVDATYDEESTPQ